jgi:hypothetical protein
MKLNTFRTISLSIIRSFSPYTHLHLLIWARAQAVRRISDKEETEENAIRELRAITGSAFQEAFQQWKKRWERSIASRGDYFEGDSA